MEFEGTVLQHENHNMPDVHAVAPFFAIVLRRGAHAIGTSRKC